MILWTNIINVKSNDKLLCNSSYLFNICRFFIPTFHKNSHPTLWEVLFIKVITISMFSCFLITEKSYHISPNKANCICKNKAIYFRWKKLFREIKTVSWISQKKWPFFMSEYKLFEFIWIIAHNSQCITLLNVNMIKGYKC